MNAAAEHHPTEKQACENITVCLSTRLGTMQFMALPQNQNNHER